jgi:hypothetical protein
LKTTPVAAPPLKKGGSPNEGCRQAGPYTFLGLNKQREKESRENKNAFSRCSRLLFVQFYFLVTPQ